MNKIKLFAMRDLRDLECAVNTFIADKNVINISFTHERTNLGSLNCCCVWYAEQVSPTNSVGQKTSSRCHKCVYELHCSKDKDNERKCPDYKRDAPDGGYYG